MDVENLAQINALITHEMQDGVLVIDRNNGIQHLNSQAQTLLGLEEKFLRGQSLYSLAPEVGEMLREWQSSRKRDDPASNILKLSHQSKELRLRFLATGESRQDGAIIFVEDWSQMQTQAHQLKLAALGRLTANIAHEIRNPLSAISHANQLLQEDDEASPSTKRMLQIIGDNVQRLDQIIKDVLELNRRDRTNQENIQLDSFVSDFYHQFCAVEKIPVECFTFENESDQRIIAFDRRHLNQILWNLCKNGWRHSSQQPDSLKLRLYSTPKLETATIEICDDGTGIPENIRSHLFEPFFTTEKSGTGLGLYIARELADANGAKLQFKTSSSGTQFFIHLKKA
jgi:two-component system sensor histidine kinase PilS (NtrC family)